MDCFLSREWGGGGERGRENTGESQRKEEERGKQREGYADGRGQGWGREKQKTERGGTEAKNFGEREPETDAPRGSVRKESVAGRRGAGRAEERQQTSRAGPGSWEARACRVLCSALEA